MCRMKNLHATYLLRCPSLYIELLWSQCSMHEAHVAHTAKPRSCLTDNLKLWGPDVINAQVAPAHQQMHAPIAPVSMAPCKLACIALGIAKTRPVTTP